MIGKNGAVLGHLRDKALVQSLARRGVPCVFFGRDEGLAMRRLARGRGIVCGTDNAAIGQMAAAYFVGQGRYASYAYVNQNGGTRGEKWSSDRRDAFKSELEAHGAHYAGEVCLREGSSNPEKMIASFKEAVRTLPPYLRRVHGRVAPAAVIRKCGVSRPHLRNLATGGE